jgi:hypothetical protein
MIDWWTCNQGETEMLMGSNQVKMKEGICKKLQRVRRHTEPQANITLYVVYI